MRILLEVRAREEADKDRAAEYARVRAIEAHQQEVQRMSEQMHHDHEVRMELLRAMRQR